MYLLAELLPGIRRMRLPLSRDQAFLLLAAVNQMFIAVDIALAHGVDGTIKPNEWIPIVYGGLAGMALLSAGYVALRNRPLATLLANAVFAVGIAIGLLGAWFHLRRAVLLDNGLFSLEAVSALIWAPPVIGPLFFLLISVLGISAAWIESPVDSGILRLSPSRSVQMPYSKTRAYMLITAIFILATLLSSALDHARVKFDNTWVWLPLAVALFGCVTCLFMGIVKRPNHGDITVHVTAMLLIIATGIIGFFLHGETSLTASGEVVVERFLRGSPLLAPLQYCNVGLMGLLATLEPGEPETP